MEMEVVLSIVAGLGLRLFLASATEEGNSNKVITTLLGMWEGVVVHQVSGRSESPKFDHLLAYGLRLVIDLLVSKDVQRMIMVILCSGLGAAVSESVVPYAILRSEIKKEREREKGRRHKPARPEPFTVPILSTPLPPRIRAYRPPDLLPVTSTPAPPRQEPIATSPQFEPPTPPSFWLQEPDTSAIYSPAPKPVQLSVVAKPETIPTGTDALPVRPQSGIAAILESDSPPPIPVPFPTPPESALSAVPSDGQLENANESKNDPKSRFERHLYTIPEISSAESGSPPTDTEAQNQGPEATAPSDPQPLHMSASTITAPLPVPNADMRRLPPSNLSQWFTNTADAIFARPFSPTNSPPGPAPLPVPVRIRQQGSSPQEATPPPPANIDEDIGSVVAEDDGDILRTPPAARGLLWNRDPDPDPLRTPQQLEQPAEEMLSPLTLDVKSGLDSQSELSRDPTPTRDEPQSATIEDFAIPGSLSQNILLHPPLPPSGPLIRRPTPPPESPPSPSISSQSGLSDISVLSTRIPNKLYGRGDELRQKAREVERTKAQIEQQRKTAEMEGRRIEALSLKVKVRDLDLETQKLHKKADRRYYAG